MTYPKVENSPSSNATPPKPACLRSKLKRKNWEEEEAPSSVAERMALTLPFTERGMEGNASMPLATSKGDRYLGSNSFDALTSKGIDVDAELSLLPKITAVSDKFNLLPSNSPLFTASTKFPAVIGALKPSQVISRSTVFKGSPFKFPNELPSPCLIVNFNSARPVILGNSWYRFGNKNGKSFTWFTMIFPFASMALAIHLSKFSTSWFSHAKINLSKATTKFSISTSALAWVSFTIGWKISPLFSLTISFAFLISFNIEFHGFRCWMRN